MCAPGFATWLATLPRAPRTSAHAPPRTSAHAPLRPSAHAPPRPSAHAPPRTSAPFVPPVPTRASMRAIFSRAVQRAVPRASHPPSTAAVPLPAHRSPYPARHSCYCIHCCRHTDPPCCILPLSSRPCRRCHGHCSALPRCCGRPLPPGPPHPRHDGHGCHPFPTCCRRVCCWDCQPVPSCRRHH
eukprot:5584951-Pleurochrysis_carterae.AAC.2